MLLKLLSELGLDQREANIYLTLLKLGPIGVTNLSKHVSIVRTSLYDTLEVIIKKGFITSTQTQGKRLFMALPPKSLQEMLRFKQKLLKENLPELEAIMSTPNTHIAVEQFIGIPALKNIYSDMLVEGKDIFHIFDYKEYSKVFKTYFIKNFIKRRIEKNIRFTALITNIKDKELSKTDPRQLRFIKKLPNKSNFNATLFIYAGKCGFFNFQSNQPVGIIINDKTAASSLKVLFDMLWEQVK